MFREFSAANARRRDDANRDVRHAWHVGRIYAEAKSKGKFPALDKFLLKDQPDGNAPTSVSQMRTAFSMLSQQYGIPMRKAKRKKSG